MVTLIFPKYLPATACAADSDPKTFEQLSSSIIEGGRVSYQNGRQELVIARSERIENRLIEVLQFLQQQRPAEAWGQFVKADGTPHGNPWRWRVSLKAAVMRR